MLPAVVTIDTVPEANERMTAWARREVEAAARERGSTSSTCPLRKNRWSCRTACEARGQVRPRTSQIPGTRNGFIPPLLREGVAAE